MLIAFIKINVNIQKLPPPAQRKSRFSRWNLKKYV